MTRRFWPELLAEAQARGELPADIDPDDLSDMMNALMITAVEGWVHGAHDALGTRARVPHPRAARRRPRRAPGLSRPRRRAPPAARSAPRHPRPHDRHARRGHRVRCAARPASTCSARDGIDGDLVLVGRGRDLRTDARRHADGARRRRVRGDDRLRRRATRHRDPSTPAIDGLEQLDRPLGVDRVPRAPSTRSVAGQGPRRPSRLPAARRPPRGRRSSPATRPSTRWRSRGPGPTSRAEPLQRRAPEGLDLLQQADLCAGWKAGGTIMQGFADGHPAGRDRARRARRSTTTTTRWPGTSSRARSRRTACGGAAAST